jgi:hypothetical protein
MDANQTERRKMVTMPHDDFDSLEAGRISHKQGLLRAQKLLLKFPGQLEIQNFIANRL